MKKSGIISILVVSLLIIGVFSAIKPVASTKELSNTNKVFVDPALKNQYTGIAILWFKEKSSINEFIRDHPDIKVTYKCRVLPFIFVKYDEKLLRMKSSGLKGIFANHRYPLPKVKLDPINEFSPTTYESSVSIGANTFWNNNLNGSGIKIAIIDSGIDLNHPDLKDKIVKAVSFANKTYGYSQDDNDPQDGLIGVWHGTMVSGVAAGAGVRDHSLGTGVAPGALLLSAKVFPRGERTTATTAGIIAAIDWAVSEGADVINMSLGGGASYGDPLEIAANEAVKYGVTVVVAAGNEGQNKRNTMSISSPGVAEDIITVGAANVGGTSLKTDYTSVGPSYHLAIKPDVVAPTGIRGLVSTESGNYYSTETAEGTSFSSPHVAGAAALIAQYLKSKGIPKKYWPGIIKSVLVKTAQPVGSYAEIIEGAGYVNLTKVYNFLENANYNADGIPLIFDVLPHAIPTGIYRSSPFFPYFQKVYQGQNLEFNMTIITSVNLSLTISFDGNISDAFDLHSPLSITVHAPTEYWEFNATFKDNVEGYFEGNITLSSSIGTIKVPMEFTLVKPYQKWLFDLKHTTWTLDFKYGQYKEFWKYLDSLNVSVEHWYFSQPPKTASQLQKYDMVFMPDAASYYYVLDAKGFDLGLRTAEITSYDTEQLIEYVNSGGNIILIGMDPRSNNFTTLNNFASNFGIRFTQKFFANGNNPVKATTVSGPFLTINVSNLPFYGVALSVDPKYATIATYNDYPVMATYSNITGGSVLVIGTNFLFDNWGMTGGYGVDGAEIKQFVHNIIELKKVKDEYFSALNIDKLTPDVGDSIRLSLSDVTGISNVIGKVKNTHLNIEDSLSFSKSNGDWIADYSIEFGGRYVISVQVTVSDPTYGEFTISRNYIFTVSTGDTTPPTITIDKENNTVVYLDVNQSLLVNVTITDDIALPNTDSAYNFAVNTTFTYKKVSSGAKEIVYQLNITTNDLFNLMKQRKLNQSAVSIKITAYDTNGNKAEALFVLKVAEKTSAPTSGGVGIDTTTLAIALVITVIAVAAIIIYIRKK